MGLWAAWGFAISHFAVEFIFAWYSSGFVFFSGDCLNCMVFGGRIVITVSDKLIG